MCGLESVGFFRSDSMDMQNDPRFFQGSILEKRLAAFAGLGVVSGLMVGSTQASINKIENMEFATLEGKLNVISFVVACVGLFSNIIAIYVSVAQVYHVHRLETSGPIGFEMGTSYYLNVNIVAWRHIAIKCLLLSLPLYLVSTGINVEVNMGRASMKPPHPSLRVARCVGFGVMILFLAMGAIVLYIHTIHAHVFRDRYDAAMESSHTQYVTRVQSMMGTRRQMPRGSNMDI